MISTSFRSRLSRFCAALGTATALAASVAAPQIAYCQNSTVPLSPLTPRTEASLSGSTDAAVAPGVGSPITRANAAATGSLPSVSSGIDTDTVSAGGLGPLPINLEDVRRIKVGGIAVSDAPLRVGNLDILSPIVGEDSSLLSKLGATASRVDPKNVPGNINTPTNSQMFQLNLAPNPPIVLTIGQSVAYINNQEQQLRAAPLVIGGKIWLPVFSITQLLGAAARLQPDGTLNLTPTIQSVELFPAKGYNVLTIKTSAPIPEGAVLKGTMDNPDKLYFDFSGYSMGFDASNSTGERKVSAGLGDVQQVRAGMFQSFPDVTRVVLDLKKPIKMAVQPLPDRSIFAIIISPSGSVKPPTPIPDPTAEPTPLPPTGGSLRGVTIVVDAGHGGHDTGAPGSKSLEKNHTLDIAKRLRDNLVARGATVLMTRDGDYFITLQGRTDFANSRRADLFVSVHIDSFRSTSSGTTTHYYTAISQPLAREVQKELIKATGRPNRGIKQSRFWVIRKTVMPSILAEISFISNPNEEALLVQPAYRDKVARSLAQGVANYVAKYGVD